MASRTICKFWQQGNCKFGDNCRFDHPQNVAAKQSNNRFAPLDDPRSYGGSNPRVYGNGSGNYGGKSRDPPRQTNNKEREIDQDQLRKDLSNERPIWILSSYSPRADLPKQLFGGPKRELSSEEVRLRHYELTANGKLQVAVQEAESVYQTANEQIENVLKDLYGAIKYLKTGYDEHPNRIDICDQSSREGALDTSSGAVVQGSISSAGVFGQPPGTVSGLPSGGSAFGQSSGTSAFGQPSNIIPTSAFGQPSSLAPASAFGQPSSLGPKAAFGHEANKASAFPPTFPRSTFGQASNVGGNQPAFGQPSGLSTTSSPFSQAAQGTRSAFGQANNPFSQGQTGGTNAAFGQTSGLFARKSISDYSMQMSPTGGSFGAPSGITPNASPGFGQPSSGSGQPVTSGGVSGKPSIASGFGQASAGSSRVVASLQQTVNGTHNSMINGAKGKLQDWNGRQVRYLEDQPCFRENDGSWQRIWFPDGPPAWAKLDILPSDLPYDADIEERYRIAKQSGQFKDGVIPLLPPKREWTSWEF